LSKSAGTVESMKEPPKNKRSISEERIEDKEVSCHAGPPKGIEYQW